MLISNWLSALVSRIRRRPRYNSRSRRAIRKRWQAVQQNRLTTVDRLEDRTLLTAQIIDGTAAADDFQVQLNADGVTLEVWNDTTLVFSDLLTNVTELSVNGGAGVDTFTVDLSNGLPFPTGNINFDGQADGGSVALDSGSYAGSLSTVTHTLSTDTSGSISIDGQIINYTNTASLTDDLDTTNRTFDFTGAAETVTLSDHGTSNDGFSSIDSTLGAAVTFVNTAAVTISTTTGSGADAINVTGLDSLNTGNVTITGDTDDDVTFQTNSTSMGANDLTVNAQTITVSSGVTSTTGAISLTASRNILLNTSSTLSTVDGGITLVANTGGTTPGSFIGIDANNASIQSTGTGNISFTSHGGNKDGIYLHGTTSITSTATGAIAGTISLNGTSGDAAAFQHGVLLIGASISSVDGAISLTGQGGGNGAGDNNNGLYLDSSSISSTGTGVNAASITLNGTAGNGISINRGIRTNALSISSVDGNISITGQGTGDASGDSNEGIVLGNSTTITSTSTAGISIHGSAGAGSSYNHGVSAYTTDISSVNADITVISDGHLLFDTNSDITATSGNLQATANYLSASNTGDLTLNGDAVFSTGAGNIDLDAAGDISLTSLVATGTVTVDSTSGSILDNDDTNIDIIAATAALTATGSIGTVGNPLTTQMDAHTAVSGTSDVNINNRELFSISDTSANEDGTFTFTVSINHATDQAVTVLASTAYGTAGASDFTAISNQLVTIAAGQTSATVTVNVTNDNVLENDETFTVVLSDPKYSGATNATRIVIGDGTATGTILNEDSVKIIDNGDPGFSQTGTWITASGNSNFYQGDYSYVDGIGGTGQNTSSWAFTDLPAGTYRISGTWSDDSQGASNMPITISGIVGGDANMIVSQRGVVEDVFDDGVSWQDLGFFEVDSNGTITVTISDDQTDGYVLAEAYRLEKITTSLSIDDVSISEDAGTATFTVTLSEAVQGGVNVDWSTANSTATAGADYTAGSGTLNFTGTAGETQTVTITLNDDFIAESDETFLVNLSNVVASETVSLADSSGTGTITDDDRVTIEGTATADNFQLQMNADGLTLEVLNNSTLIYSGLLADIAELNINGGAGADTFTVDLSNGLPFPTGNITFDGETDGGSIVLDSASYVGSLTTVTHTLNSDTSGSISIDGQIINYTNTASLTDDLDTTNRTFDFTGAAETVTLSDHGTSNDGFSSIDSTLGAAVTFVNTAAVTISTTTGSGADAINVTGLDSLNTGNVTITGDTDDDVTFQTNSTVMGANDLTVNAQTITVSSGISSTSGAISLTASRNILLNATSTLSTVDGGITLAANTGGTTPGSFIGIDADNATIQSTGTGNISFSSHGSNNKDGIYLHGTTSITSTATGVTAGTISLNGTGGGAASFQHGILLIDASISSVDGAISLTGQGGGDGTGNNNNGLYLQDTNISSTGTGINAATITLDGTAGNGISIMRGIRTALFSITSVDGDISVTGQGAGDVTGADNEGIVFATTTIASTGNAAISIHGSAGAGLTYNQGLYVSTTDISSVNADISMISDGHLWFDSTSDMTATSGNIQVAANYLSVNNTGNLTIDGNAVISTGAGNIDLDAAGDISLTSLVATGTVTVDSTSGSILDNDDTNIDISAATATLNAAGSIGTVGNPLTTQMDAHTAVSGTSDVNIDNRELFSISDTIANEDGTFTFTVSINHATDQSVTVLASTAYGTAGASDLTPINNQLVTIAAGQTSATVTVNVTNDSLVEDNETFTVVLSDPKYNGVTNSTRIIIGDGTAASTILDEDTASLSIDDIVVNESAGTATLTVTLNNNVDTGFTVDYSTQNNTATSGADYTLATGQLSFLGNAGETQTITVTINENTIVEATENFFVNLSNVTISGNHNVTITDSQGQISITDNDAATLSIADITVDENTGTATFTVILDQAVQGGVTVDWATADGTANAVSDYLAGSGTLNFAGTVGETQSITVTINEDNIVEPDETILVNLINLVAAGNVTLPLIQATATITDNDAATLSIADLTVDENTGTATFTVILDQAVQGGVTVDWATADGTANVVSDYLAGSSTLNFAGTVGETQSITFTINEDNIVEPDETILVNLTNLVAAGNVTLPLTQATATITDNDAATLSIADITVDENTGTATFTVILDQAVQGGVTVDWATADGTANVVSDYLAGSGTLNFAGTVGETQTITVTINDDNIVEPDETFLINLTNLVAAGNVTLPLTQATATITNDDGTNLSISDVSVNESAGTVTFSVTSTQAIGTPFSIDYATADGTSLAGTDYTATNGTLNFAGNIANEVKTITVTLNNDNIVELAETLIVNLSNLISSGNVTITKSQATATINNDDNATLSIADLTVNENAGTATFNVTLDQAVQGGVTVDWATADGTAIATLDYLIGSGTLNFAGTAGETQSITVDIIDDAIVELAQSFSVNLSNALHASGASISLMTISDNIGIATITDNEPAANVSIADVFAAEDGILNFEISLDRVSDQDITVILNTAYGTADSADFTAIVNQTVTITAGSTSVLVPVTVNNELLIEADETFTAVITDPKFNGISDPAKVILADDTAVGTIQNDDIATISISDATIDEDAGTATFYVSVSHQIGQVFSIDYEAVDGSATVSDGDYLANSGTLVFFGNAATPMGVETLAITVLINNDQKSETSENFHVDLSGLSLTNPNLVLGDSQGQATINDDDSASFSINDVTVNEADGTAVLTVSLDKDIDTGVSVDWSTADDTAVQGTDYSSASGTLNFTGTAGETQTITITLPQDTDVESTEQFFINLSNVQSTGQTVNIADNQGVVSITDDDSASVSINDITVNEADGTAVFTVTLTGQVGESVTVDWSTADNTADEISDYEASSGTLTFIGNTGETQTITVNLQTDGFIEAVESFYVNLTNATSANKAMAISDAQGEATISANAEEFSINDILTQEGDGVGTKTMTFTVTRNGADLTQQATIDFRTLTDPADLGGGDFVPVSTPVTLTFAAAAVGVTTQTQTVTVTINKDDTIEVDEEFTVQLENASSGTIVKSQGTGTIVNDDQATLTFSGTEIYPGHAPLEYGEHYGNAYVIVTLDKDVTGGLTVDWSTEDIDALDGLDYTANSGTLTFAGNAGETQTITIALLNDAYVEENETFAVNFSNLAINDPLLDPEVKEELLKNISLPNERAVVEVVNDDGGANPTISFASYKVGYEGISNSVELNAVLDQAVFNGATFQYTVIDGTASGAENDYTPQTGIITFQGTANEWQPITIAINDDSLAELDETFYIELTQLTGASLPIDLSNAYAIIVDNDTSAVTASVSDITINEDDEVATFTVSLSQATIVDLSMLVNTGDPGDTAGVTDYFNLTDYQITIPAGQTSVTIDIPLYRDLLVEEDETFTLTLSDLKANGGTATGWATFSDATAVATITDTETTGLSISDAVVDENAATATFTVSLGTVAAEDVTFNASTVDGTATGGVDFTAFTNQPYTITAGQSSIDITVNITNDSLFELNETFSLVLSNILVGGVADDRLTILKGTGIGTINDDEAANITIADLTVNEAAGNAVLTVTVDQIVGYAFSVDWATQGETAYGASDYTTSSGTLNFTGLTANETQQITIPILDDDIVEWDETFLVNLSNVSAGGANVTLADDQAQVTISGNNDIATLSIGDVTALEHNQFGFEITLDKAATKDITVLASTADGTADSSDYTALTDYLVTIAAGETSAFVYVTVNDDDLVEGSETFTVSLSGELIDGAIDSSRVAVGTGALGTATGTISNNDFNDPTTTANAVDDYYFIKVEDLGTTVELNVLANDTKTGTTTITSITSASGGGAASVGQTVGDDVIVFTPGNFASGTITFNYTFEDASLNTGTGQVTIVIVDAYGITGDFKNDRYVPDIATPGLGKVPEYISQAGFIADYLTKFENPSLVDNVDTVDILDTVIYQNALGTGGSFSVTTDIDSTLTKDYTDNGGGSWTYSEDLVSTYTITTSFSESIGVSEFNTLTLVQSGTHNYQYDLTHTVPGTGNATTTWTLNENASDHYDIEVDITVEEPGEDEYTTVETVTTLDKTFNYGNQNYTLMASETREDDGQGGDILIAEAHDITLFQKDEYKETIVATATVAQGVGQLGTSIVTVNTDGATEWTRESDRDYDYDAVNDEYTNSEGFSYSSLGHDNYSSVESTNILGTINETEDVTVSEETTDANGTVIPAVVLSTTISTYSNIDIDTTDISHDEFTFNYTGDKDFNNLGSNTLDTEITTYSYSDSGYSDYSTDEYSVVETNSNNAHGDQRLYILDDIVENSHTEYATTTSNTSRSGNTSGSAHSEYTTSGWNNYDIYTQNIIDVTDESVPDIVDDYTLTETVDNYGSDTYRDFEALDEQIVSSNLEGTSSYISASNGVDHHSLTSTTTTSTVNTQFPGSVLTITSLIESTDQGTTNWGSSYSDKGNYQEYDYITPISAPGLIRHSYNLENYAVVSSGNQTTSLHTRNTSAYSEGATLNISSSNDFDETNRSYNFVDSSSGFSKYTTDEESLDATGDQRKSTFTTNEEDQASYTETNGSSAYIIDNDSSQFVDNAINGITTQHTGLDTYDETGSKTWNVNEGEIAISTRTDISTTTDGGENWVNDEVNSTSETTSHDWTEFNESGSSSFTIHSELDKTTIDQSVPGIKNTVIISNEYDESSDTVTSEEGATPLSNNSFNKSLRTDNYLYADGTTSNVINSKSYESSASTYYLNDSSSFELINTTNPAVTSEQRGNFAHTRTGGERTSQVTSSEFSTTTGTPLAEGTPDSATNDPLISVYNLDEVRYVKVGKTTNEESQTDRSNYTLGETSSLIDITVQHSAQTTPDSQSLITQLINRAGFSGTSGGIAPHATSGGYGGSGNSYTFGDGLNIPPGTISPMGGSFYRISISDSSSNDAGSEFQKSKETLNISFLGELGVESASLAEVTEIDELSEHTLSYNTFETSRATPVPDSGTGSTAIPLPSFQSARSEYTEFINQEPGAVHSTTNFLSFSSMEDTSGNVSQETINRITASTNLEWDLKEYLEDGAGNNGTNSKLLSNGKSTYAGIHEEVITNVTDPNQTGQFLTTTVVTDNFVTHAEDYSHNDIRYGGSNQLSSGWTIDLRFLQIGEHIVDTEVDVVITTDVHGVTTETGKRHTFRDNLKDHSSYALEVEGNFGGGSSLSGTFSVSADGGSTSIGTEDITMIDGTITDRAITELLTTGNGYHFQMSADGNGFEIVTSAGGGNSLEQNKRGNLNYEVIDGTRTNDSGYYSQIQIDGFGDTTSSGKSGDKTLYHMTRYFDQNGSTSDFLLNQYNKTTHLTTDRNDGRTGTGYHEEQYSTTRGVDSNQQGGPGKTSLTSGGFIFYDIDQNGNPTGVHESDNEVDAPHDWLVDEADLFAEFQATLPFFDPLAVVSTMMAYVGGGSWDFSGLGFLDNGASQTAPTPTGDPVSSGTEPDGTYWEHYDNGIYWLYREYASEGGDLVKEEWGYHTQSFYDLLQGFNQLIEEASENVVINKIDEFFADLTEVGNSLSQTNNVPDKAEQTIEDIAEQQEEHLPIPYIYPQSRRFDIFNPDAPGNGPGRGKIPTAKELRDALVDKQIDLYFGEASELKKKIAALEANRTTTTPIGFGAATIDTTGPKTAEQLELEKQLERVLAEADFIRKLTQTRDPQETIGPYAGFALPEKFQKVIETAWEQGYFGDKVSKDLEALQNPEVLNDIGETLALFTAAYAVAHYLPVTYAVDGLLMALTAGEAGQVLKDLYEAYLEVQFVTHESELPPAAKKLAELLVAASESGALSILLHGARKALPNSTKNGDFKKDLEFFDPDKAPPLTDPKVTLYGADKIRVRAKEGGLMGKITNEDLFIDLYQVRPDYLGNNFGTSLIREAIEKSSKKIKSVSGKLGGTNLDVFDSLHDIWKTPIGKSMRELGFDKVSLNGKEFTFYKGT